MLFRRLLLSDSFSYIRKLDFYVLKTFVFILAIAAFSLTGLYVIIHFFTDISDFIQAGQENGFFFIPYYYIIRIPLIINKLLPVMALIAVMMTTSKLINTKELVAILSSGISFHRTILPVFIIILLLIGLMYFTDEVIIPSISKDITLTEKILKAEGWDRFLMRNTKEHFFTIKKYIYARQEMKDVWINQYDKEGNFINQIVAAKARWSSKESHQGWLLSDGVVYSYDENGFRKSSPYVFHDNEYLLVSELTPRSIARTEETSSYLKLSQLKELAQTQPQNYSLQVQYYSKITAPFIILILIFIGLPFAVIQKSHGFFVGAGLCLLISLAFFITKSFSESLSNKGLVAPFWSVFLPLLVFTIIGIILSKRIRT
jgi:lipopolysaccharide export system permease protein